VYWSGCCAATSRRGTPDAPPGTAPEIEDVPTLAEMTESALNVLDHASDQGLFLMVEGGAIDWASHDNALGRAIEEQLAFNEAVETVVDWVNRESSWRETLVVVTADHETGYLTGPGSDPAWRPMTGERGELPAAAWGTGGHTNSLVPVYAKGAGATRLRHYAGHRDPVRGAYLENIHIAEAVFDHWGRPAAPGPDRS
jgi:alkaline phosphatase